METGMGRKRILLLDDCRLTLAMLTDILKKAGFEVAVTQSVMEANKMICHQRCDMLISDVEMPFVSGDAIVRIMKSGSMAPDIPVLLMSGKTSAEMEVLCASSGADGYLMKPLVEGAVIKKVSAVFGLNRPEVAR